jgi:hypothetical protein
MARNTLDSRSIQNKKHFAAAINSARHNLFIAIKHISAQLNLKIEEKEENLMHQCELMKMLSHGGKNDQVQKAIDLLDRNMPFLKPMLVKEQFDEIKEAHKNKDNDREEAAKVFTRADYYAVLRLVMRTLNAYRNEYTHHDPIDTWKEGLLKEQRTMVQYLYSAFDGARRIVKDRFSFTADDMEFITGDERYENVYNGGQKPQKRERRDWFYRLCDKNGRYLRLSDVGLVMFVSLLVNKQQAYQFIEAIKLNRGRVKGGKSQSLDNEKKIIFETFTVYRIKIARERVDSTRPDYALGLDILNELQKCPAELFETLSPENQDLLRVEGTDDSYENLMMRYTDRFPRLAMAYIDQKEVLPDMCFQVALGKYRHTFYDKKCVDGETRVRSLQKEINGFGRLDKVEEVRRQQYGEFLSEDNLLCTDTADTKPYITDQHAAYKITGNRVALMFNTESRKVLTNCIFLPTLGGRNTRCEYPQCWLSVYELPALLFHHFLTKDTDNAATAKIIKDCVARYHNFFNDIAKGRLKPVGADKYASAIAQYGIEARDVPQEIEDYLKNAKVDIDTKIEDTLYATLDKQLADITRRKERFESDYRAIGTKENKLGKKAFADLRPGRLAAWIAEDLVKWQPAAPAKNGKLAGWNRPTGLNFSVMQAALAQYSGDIDQLKSVFVSVGMIGGEYGHLFLDKVLDRAPKDMLNFYKEYCFHKKLFLENVIRGKCSNSIWEKVAELLVPATQRRWMSRTETWYMNLAKKYLSAPVELPRGLFEKAIKEAVRGSYADYPELMAVVNAERCNIAYLIVKFHEIVEQDGCQIFYCPEKGYRRNYKYFDVVKYEIVNRNQLAKHYLDFGEMEAIAKSKVVAKSYLEDVVNKAKNSLDYRRAENQEKYLESVVAEAKKKLSSQLSFYKANESAIRLYKVQDIILFRMARYILQGQLSGDKSKVRLEDIRPDNEQNILAMQVPFSITLTLASGRKVTVKQDAIKIKNFGDFFKFVYDGRLLSLLPHVEEAVVDREELERELQRYDVVRPEIFGVVHELEQAVIDADPHRLVEAKNGQGVYLRNNFRSLLEYGIKHKLVDADQDKVVEIRNRFSHNGYPVDDYQGHLPQIAEHYETEMKEAKK